MKHLAVLAVLVAVGLPACSGGPGYESCVVGLRGVNATFEAEGWQAKQQCNDYIKAAGATAYLAGGPSRYPAICERTLGMVTVRVRDSGTALIGSQMCQRLNQAADLNH